MAGISLKSNHLLIDSSIVASVLADEVQVNLVYYPERNTILIAAKSKVFFEKMHKDAHWMTLKTKNAKGDKSLAIHEILIDNDLDDEDRELDFEVKSTGIIAINL